MFPFLSRNSFNVFTVEFDRFLRHSNRVLERKRGKTWSMRKCSQSKRQLLLTGNEIDCTFDTAHKKGLIKYRTLERLQRRLMRSGKTIRAPDGDRFVLQPIFFFGFNIFCLSWLQSKICFVSMPQKSFCIVWKTLPEIVKIIFMCIISDIFIKWREVYQYIMRSDI